MLRTFHFARDNITSLQVVFGGFYGPGAGTGYATTITASVEYPSGTFTQVLFSGLASGVAPADGVIISDPVAVTIPAGDKFFIRQFREADAFIWHSGATGQFNSSAGDRVVVAASGVTDQTMSGSITSNNSIVQTPLAIIARTAKPSILIIGDSKSVGTGQTATLASGDLGEIAQSLGGSFAYINIGMVSDRAKVLVSGVSPRLLLARYCSHVICDYGINDVHWPSASAADTYADILALKALLGREKFFQLTIAPSTTATYGGGSTDGWATEANQTIEPTYNAIRTDLNDLIRAGSGLDGYFEIADVVENSRNGGKWKGGYSGDGLHENATGYAAIVAAGAIPASAIVR